jgi:hypothetical protein
MAATSQTIAIARALLALSDAVGAVHRALLALAPSQEEGFLNHIEASIKARAELTENLKILFDLMDKNGE